MKRPFVDTSFLIALALKKDTLHEAAKAWHQHAGKNRVTTEYVLVEFADALCEDEPSRWIAADTIHTLRTSPKVTVVPASEGLLKRGLTLYEHRRDKRWSLTDCISFIAMEDLGLTDALSADHHFEQAGFRALLRLPVPS